jgi:tripartite ATP-independent transporter DctM subunit
MMDVPISYQNIHSENVFVRSLSALNSAVIRVVGFLAALLVVAEVIILLTGVTYRYALHDPLIWVDELAITLFIWLTMMGSVLALDRGEHMRLTALVSKLSEKWRIWLEAVSSLVVCVFVLLIIHPAIEHASEQMYITTPALEIPDGLRAAALPVGAILMFLAATTRMLNRASFSQVLSAAAVVAGIGGVLWLSQGVLAAMGNYNLIVFFMLLIGVCVAGGVPIAFAFGTATMSYLMLMTDAPLLIVPSRMDEGMSSMVLLSVPLFVLLGSLLEASGLARTLIDFMASLLGHVRGGLQYVLLGAMFLVSGISGSKAADMAAVAPALFPEMKKRGAKPEDLVALLSTSGAMTETIPPSLVLITIGAVCGVSITALFIGGLMPALVATIAIAAVCWYKSRKSDEVMAPRAPLSVILKALVMALPALALPLLIRAVVIEGVATATEVATIGVAYTVVVGLILHMFMRQIKFKTLYPILIEAAALSGAIMIIIGMATAMAWALTQSGFSGKLVEIMKLVPGGSFGFLLVTIVFFIVLGSILEGIPAIVLFGPLLFPVARALEIHDVHYAMVVILAMGVGLFAPPLGVGFYTACAIGKVSPDKVFSKVWGYLGVLLLALILIAAVPWFSIGFLPSN